MAITHIISVPLVPLEAQGGTDEPEIRTVTTDTKGPDEVDLYDPGRVLLTTYTNPVPTDPDIPEDEATYQTERKYEIRVDEDGHATLHDRDG